MGVLPGVIDSLFPRRRKWCSSYNHCTAYRSFGSARGLQCYHLRRKEFCCHMHATITLTFKHTGFTKALKLGLELTSRGSNFPMPPSVALLLRPVKALLVSLRRPSRKGPQNRRGDPGRCSSHTQLFPITLWVPSTTTGCSLRNRHVGWLRGDPP